MNCLYNKNYSVAEFILSSVKGLPAIKIGHSTQ